MCVSDDPNHGELLLQERGFRISPGSGLLLGNRGHRPDAYTGAQLSTDRPTVADKANGNLEIALTQKVVLPMYVIVSLQGRVLRTFEGSPRNPKKVTEFLIAPNG